MRSSDREITGSIRFNLVNKPKVKIARMTGQLSVSSGFGEFDGKQSGLDWFARWRALTSA
jgi:hypothetical protein